MVLELGDQQLQIQKEYFLLSEGSRTILQGYVTPKLVLLLMELQNNLSETASANGIVQEAIRKTLSDCTQKRTDKKQRICFEESSVIYDIVQKWKHSPAIITGDPDDWKPEGMSAFRFTQIIRKLYNCSYAHLVRTINMQKAMKMLMAQHSIPTVSAFAGYTREENFISAFKKNYGITPGRIRKQLRQRSFF